MLNIGEIKTHIATALDTFRNIYPNATIPKIVVCSSSRRYITREKVLAECGVSYKEDIYGTDAEVISGALGTQIILYQSMMKNKGQVCHAIWHELGHLMFGSEEKYNIDLKQDTPFRSGYAVVNEFMAEYIAYTVNEFESFGCSQKAHIYLQMTFMECIVNPYWLSRYLAIIIGDKNVFEEEIDFGEQFVLPEAWEIILSVINELFKQTDKENFWNVSPDFLECIGSLYDELFHIYFMQGR